MDLEARLLEYVRKGERGIEIGPWYRPIAPKRGGYATLVVDAFPRDVLVARVLTDPDAPAHLADVIEDVDIVAAGGLADEIGRRQPGERFAYVIASHVIEHLPDPLAFLHDCEQLIDDHGVVSLAVPDKRVCFDHFAHLTEVGDIVAAGDSRRRTPTPAQVFNFLAYRARSSDGRIAFSLESDPAAIALDARLGAAFAAYQRVKATEDYEDIHCWRFTPSSFLLLLSDLAELGLTGLRVLKATPTVSSEFVVHLAKAGRSDLQPMPPRAALVEAIRLELAEYTPEYRRLEDCVRRQQADIARLEAEIDRLRADQARLEDDRRTMAHTLDAIRSSRSWRVTKPVRAVTSRLRGRR